MTSILLFHPSDIAWICDADLARKSDLAADMRARATTPKYGERHEHQWTNADPFLSINSLVRCVTCGVLAHASKAGRSWE